MPKKICKDMLTMCPAAALASSHAHNAAAAAVRDNAPRDPAPDAKPNGTPRCKIACTSVHAESKKARSSRADRTAASKNLRRLPVCAGPRATRPRQLTPAAHAAAADAVAPVPGAAVCRSPLLDSVGSPASSANAELLADMPRCNNALANAAARTAVHSP